MKMKLSIIFTGLLLIVTGILPIYAAPIPATGTIEAFFSPNGGCTDAIVREINNAKSDILIQAYSFTSVPIAKAVIQAKKRGVSVG